MMNVIAIDDEPLALNLIETFCNQIADIKLRRTFTKPNEALKYLRKFPVDLIFLDIRMPAMNGMDLIKAVQQNTMVIFTTAFSDYAIESYEVNAIDYLLKPITFKRFRQAVTKAVEYFAYINNRDKTCEKSIFIRADYSLVKIPLDEILYVEGLLADYMKIFIKERKAIITRLSMKALLKKLPGDRFIRVHRSYIVPVNRIEAVRNKVIYLPEKAIPIGNTYVEDFFKRFATNHH